MSGESKSAAFLLNMQSINAEQEKWLAAHKSGDQAAKRQAEDRMSVYMAEASKSVPPVALRNKAQGSLSAGSDLFAARGHEEKKRGILTPIIPCLVYCSRVKRASDFAEDLATGGARLALNCLTERNPWNMSTGSVADVAQLTNPDHTTTTLLWDLDGDGSLDYQETIDPATNQFVEEPHVMTDGDTWTDVWDAACGLLG